MIYKIFFNEEKAFYVILVSVFWGDANVATNTSGWPSPRELIWVDYGNAYLLSVCL